MKINSNKPKNKMYTSKLGEVELEKKKRKKTTIALQLIRIKLSRNWNKMNVQRKLRVKKLKPNKEEVPNIRMLFGTDTNKKI